MTQSVTRKTTGVLLSVSLLVTTMLLSLAPAQGNEDAADDAGVWIANRAVIGYHDKVPASAIEWVEARGGTVLLANDVIHFILAEFPDDATARATIKAAQQRADVRYAEHDAVVQWDEPVKVVMLDPLDPIDPDPYPLDGYTPNNPLWPDQWGPKAINAPGAWEITKGSHDVRIAIADDGITGTHPNLQGNICGPHFTVNTDPLAMASHGTHVAGIAAARIDTGIGIAGMSQSCLMAIKVIVGSSSAGHAAGIIFAADNGADVINMSFLALERQVFRDALHYAYLEKDVVLVSAAGNNAGGGGGNGNCEGGLTNLNAWGYEHNINFPAYDPAVIAVAALAPPGNTTAWFSSCGNQMELAAPGEDIIAPYSTASDPWTYASYGGTSMAAPHVTGLVGLMRSVNPELTALEVRCLLVLTADDLDQPGWDPFTGWGRINAEEAVRAAQDWVGGTLRQNNGMMTCGLPVPKLDAWLPGLPTG